MVTIGETSTERWCIICDTKFRLLAKWASSWLRNEMVFICGPRVFRWMRIIRIIMVFWWMRIRSLDLHEAFGADRLVTTSRLVQVRRIIEEADWTLRSIFVDVRFQQLAMYIRVLWKLQFLRTHFLLRIVARGSQRSQCFGTTTEEWRGRGRRTERRRRRG